MSRKPLKQGLLTLKHYTTMKTIQLQLFTFDELSAESKEAAIKQERNSLYENNDFASQAIDDDSLLEPAQDELDKIGFKSSGFLIENTRNKIFFDTDRNNFIDIEDAIKITNDKLFLAWLGVPERLQKQLNYRIYTPNFRNASTVIKFENYEDILKADQKFLATASKKFSRHLRDILKQIESNIDYNFTDDAIIEYFVANEVEFTEDGKRWNK